MPTTALKLVPKVESFKCVALRDFNTILWPKRVTQGNALIVPAAKYINDKNKKSSNWLETNKSSVFLKA